MHQNAQTPVRGEQGVTSQKTKKTKHRPQSLGALRTPSKDNEDKETTPSQPYTSTNATTHNNRKPPIKKEKEES